jgi:GT2 family glycosyltransferase
MATSPSHLERDAGASSPRDDDLPEVSVIVPTYNRLPRLQRMLDALADQTYPRECYEVVVISDGSTDGTDEYLRSAPPMGVVFDSQENAGPAAARNRGIELARGELLLFIDDDVVATPDLIKQHVASHHNDKGDLVVIGPMATPPGIPLTPWIEWEQVMLYRQYDAMLEGEYRPTPRQFYTGNASVARAAVLAVGGFDTRFRRAEDIELAYRLEDAGLQFEFNPDAIGYHHADRSFESWLKNAHDYGVNDVVFARDQGRESVGIIVTEGFARRPAPVRWITQVILTSPHLLRAVAYVFKCAFSLSEVLRSNRAARFALSGLYNASYYGGVAAELGGASAFRDAVVGSRWVRT